MNQTRESIEIDLKRMVLVLWSNLWVILLVGFLVACLSYGYARFMITPSYSATTQLYVNNNYDSPGFSTSQITAAKELADTYMVIMKSRNVLDEVAEETQLGYDYGQLKKMISAAAVNETEIFQVTVTCANYHHAAMIANSIAHVLPEKIPAVVVGSSVRVVDYAVEKPLPVGPSRLKYAIVGAMIGCVIAAMVVVVFELMDTSINSEEYLAHVYSEYPLLAVVPGAQSTRSGYKGYYKGYYRGYYAEKPKESAKTPKAPAKKPAKPAAKPVQKPEKQTGGAQK